MRSTTRRRSVIVGLAAAGGLAAGLLVAPPATAHPDHCVSKDSEEVDESECFTDSQIAEFDDSGAPLATPGQMASSPNLRLISSTPKSGIAAGQDAYNSDLAFVDGYAIQGNYNGFSVWDVRRPGSPTLVGQAACLGAQNDVSVYGDIVITSTDSRRVSDDCDAPALTRPATSDPTADYWEGIRVWSIADKSNPQLLTSVETDCGSHTNTLVPDPAHGRMLVYVSSYGPSAAQKDCQTPHDKISIVAVPDADPASAAVVAEPVLFPDGGFAGATTAPDEAFPTGRVRSATSGCHDITAYPEKGIAAGACMGQGVLMDISDPLNPQVTSSVTDENFTFWHSATFDNDATKVVFTDELGGGGAPTCNPTIGDELGANAVYDIVDGQLVKRSYFKIPRTQTNEENCVAHNGSLIPNTQGRDIMVQAWYQGGISVWDFTDSANPREIAWFDRGPVSADQLVLGGSWSAYFYDGLVYSSDIQQGFDVLKLNDPAIAGAGSDRTGTLNPQSQTRYTVGNSGRSR
ncbi:LVIVD repeat-containing protein [Geodermatophilus sp. SYSU D00700]